MNQQATNSTGTANEARYTHTPPPWHIKYGAKDARILGEPFRFPGGDKVETFIATVGDGSAPMTASQNARFIVRACNSHAALVAALEDYPSHIDGESTSNWAGRVGVWALNNEQRIRAALAAARQ